MNPFEFALGVILILTIGGAVKMFLKDRGRGGEGDGERERLRQEVVTLRDRVAVLERIATDKESTLERDIERLRDR